MASKIVRGGKKDREETPAGPVLCDCRKLAVIWKMTNILKEPSDLDKTISRQNGESVRWLLICDKEDRDELKKDCSISQPKLEKIERNEALLDWKIKVFLNLSLPSL